MKEIFVAFYKYKRPIHSCRDLWYRLCDEVTRLSTKGKYSHCEIAVKQEHGLYECYTSSVRDKGVRVKVMSLSPEKWDLVDVSSKINYEDLKSFYEKTKDMEYDFSGALGVVLHSREDHNKYFCSEWCADSLGYTKPSRISPNKLYKLLRNK